MEREKLEQIFDPKCASGYDQQWAKMGPGQSPSFWRQAAWDSSPTSSTSLAD
jgi:hypothetical protein